ncbi:hypothetical protein [Mycobacterium riyadhense]|uniref:Uncharacterized protein n=2 Tax=Mycobacterium riyadhense TaxID=486698 RepID=A0A1X2CIQ1_9MYCO|nr:hypothetical protein [Mycobacterium riyadhense]ORW75836.1 hypothetical protein AWC22_22210 [Mycobacterium riyadhense]
MATRRKHKQKPAVVAGPVEIADAGHEWVIERVAAIDVVKAAGKVCVGGSSTTRCRRRALRCSWSMPGM